MHRLEEAGAGQMRQASRVVAIGLVGRQRLERLVGLPALDAHHGEAEAARHREFAMASGEMSEGEFRRLTKPG